MHKNIAIGTLQRRAGNHDMLARFAAPVDFVCDRLQPGPAVLIGEGMAGFHLGDVACGMELVAILIAPAEPLGQFIARWCSCPIRIRPSRSLRTGSRRRHCSRNSPEAPPDPTAILSRLRNAHGSPAGPRHPAPASGSHAFRAPLASNSISRQEPSAGNVSVTRGTNGSTCALGTPTTQCAASSTAG